MLNPPVHPDFESACLDVIRHITDSYRTWDQLVAAAVPPGLPGAPQPEEEPTLW